MNLLARALSRGLWTMPLLASRDISCRISLRVKSESAHPMESIFWLFHLTLLFPLTKTMQQNERSCEHPLWMRLLSLVLGGWLSNFEVRLLSNSNWRPV
jgi:hypothetical protein